MLDCVTMGTYIRSCNTGYVSVIVYHKKLLVRDIKVYMVIVVGRSTHHVRDIKVYMVVVVGRSTHHVTSEQRTAARGHGPVFQLHNYRLILSGFQVIDDA
jgi:hypothetical protein